MDTRAHQDLPPLSFRFSLSFAPDAPGIPGLIGNPATYGLMYNVGVQPDPNLGPTIPVALTFLNVLMCAIVTPSIIIGAIAERCALMSLFTRA